MSRRVTLLTLAAAAAFLACTVLAVGRRPADPAAWTSVARPPHMRPDYAGATIPPNIAPLNFAIEERAAAYCVRIEGGGGGSLTVHSRDGGVRFPLGKWKAMLRENRGNALSVEIFVRDDGGRWQRFEPIRWTVAAEEIDSHLVYRLIDPTFSTYKYLGVYQRDLESFDESRVLFGGTFDQGCVNCHAFPQNRPDLSLIHVRPGLDPSIQPGMIVVRDGTAARVNTRAPNSSKLAGFTAWHPSGKVAVFSVNDTVQYMHGAGKETREVYDRNSDLALLDFRTESVTTNPAIAAPDRAETFPAWSPDGKYLYFSSAPSVWDKVKDSLLENYQNVKYDLMRVRYDQETNAWGKPEAISTAAETGKSIVEPRPSPDGRYVLVSMCDHGPFPAFRADSDLYLLELANRHYRRLEANSPRSESWHCWSSNSRWIVFESRRDNGHVAWPYLCYLDASGQDHTPLLLPQEDPRFYDTCLKTYNLPELITGPVAVSERELLKAVRSHPRDENAGPAATMTRE